MLRLLIYLVLLLPTVTSVEGNKLVGSRILIFKDEEKFDFNFIHNFTKYLHNIHRFECFVTFARSHERFRSNFLAERSLQQALVEDFNMPIIVWGTKRSEKLRQNIGLNNMVFVQITSLLDPILDVVDYTLEGRHSLPMLFFYKDKKNVTPTVAEIQAFFAWCWSKYIVNAVLTIQAITIQDKNDTIALDIQNRVYSYSPFPKPTVFNLTEKEAQKGGVPFVWHRIKDVKGYSFKTFLVHMPPWCYWKRKTKKCKINGICSNTISGISGRLYTEFIKQIGGTLKIVEYFNLSRWEALDKLIISAARQEIDIGVYPFSDLIFSPEIVEGSYPFGQLNSCIITPLRREIPPELYLLRSFQLKIWMTITITFLLLFALQIYFGYGETSFSRNPVTLCGYALLSTISVLLTQSSRIKLFQVGRPYYKFLHLIILVMAFVLCNMYEASLTSLLTTEPVDAHINTVDEFLASGLEILVSSGDQELYFHNNYLPSKLINRLRVVEGEILTDNSMTFSNGSYAFILTSAQWSLLSYKHRYLSRKIFHMPSTELCTPKMFLKLPLQWDSPFFHSLKIFIMTVQESGISLRWTEKSQYEAAKMKLFKPILDDLVLWKPLGLQYFFLVEKFIFVLWLLAIVCFIAELSWYYFTKYRIFCNKRKAKIQYSKELVRKRAGKYYKKEPKKKTLQM